LFWRRRAVVWQIGDDVSSAFGSFAREFPDIQLKRGARFVEDGNLATAGGLSSGIDLALRVVERYFGREVAQKNCL